MASSATASSALNPAARLEEEIRAAEDLRALLKQEQALLIEADIDGLAGLTEPKSQAVARLSDLAAARHRALGLAGFPDGEAGMQQWLASAASDSKSKTVWSRLLEVMQSGKQLNHTNGILINTHMSRNQATLAVLQQNARGAGTFYGPDGQATVKSVARGVVVG